MYCYLRDILVNSNEPLVKGWLLKVHAFNQLKVLYILQAKMERFTYE